MGAFHKGHSDENGGNISEMRGTQERVGRYGGQRQGDWRTETGGLEDRDAGIGGHLLPLKA